VAAGPGSPTTPEVRLTARLLVGAGIAAAAVIPFLLVLLLVEGRYEGLEHLDRSVADALNRWARARPGAVSVLKVLQNVLSPNVFRLAVAIAAVALWRSRSRRLAIWAVVTTATGALLGVALKQLVHRARPTFADPVASAGSYSFPSGHALGSFLGAGVLLLIVLPLLDRRGKAVAWTAAVFLVVLTGFDRVALGVHFVSDVLAGWFVAGAVIVATVKAFGVGRRRPLTQGLDPAGSERLADEVDRSVHHD
jgi:membrane-associated phospholipid phosphatase